MLNQKMLFLKNNIDLDGIRFGFVVRRIDLKKSDKENETIQHNTAQISRFIFMLIFEMNVFVCFMVGFH